MEYNWHQVSPNGNPAEPLYEFYVFHRIYFLTPLVKEWKTSSSNFVHCPTNVILQSISNHLLCWDVVPALPIQRWLENKSAQNIVCKVSQKTKYVNNGGNDESMTWKRGTWSLLTNGHWMFVNTICNRPTTVLSEHQVPTAPCPLRVHLMNFMEWPLLSTS